MGSSSREQVDTDTTNYALDRRVVLESGQAIVDSVIASTDDEVVTAALQPTLASWESMANSGRLNLIEVIDMANELIEQIDKSQLNISAAAEANLRAGREMFEDMLQANRLTVELVDDIQDRSFDLSENALDIVADVKTGDFSELSKTIMLFALAAMAMSFYYNGRK
ncbi:MAG: hypothetical protein AAF429_14475 [Pseudomonadota bacterium]